MNEEPKPCPLCGMERPESWDDDGAEMVSCANPNCHLSSDFMPLRWWNQRPIEDALRAEIARLKA